MMIRIILEGYHLHEVGIPMCYLCALCPMWFKTLNHIET